MKMIKQTMMMAAMVTAGVLSAQSANMNNMLKMGINAGAATGGNASASLGFDLAYQNLVTPGFGLGIATGYNHFFGKEKTLNNVTVRINDFGIVPVAALVRFYPGQSGFYGGADLGYGFIVGDEKVTNHPTVNADRPDGGFYLKPEIGYHNRDWNFFIHFTKVFTGDKGKVEGQDYGAGSVGAGVGYNIPLGK
ncbi:MAG: hypothetical protein EAS48_02950 [Chryseobacterium sp.]|nr:MAG: hypothetical protein EAS48_02950 [Chryseobacterium sp.]